MGLIDLKTDLTSLRYGSDTKGGGESQSAKFMNNIYSPETTGVDQSFDQPSQNPQSSGDFLLRGGILYPNRVTNDFQRIGKFMTSWRGVGFIAKQNLLARQQNKVPLGQQPTRIYNPLNTLAEVAGGSNSTGLHLDGKGLFPQIPEESKYFATTKRNSNNNRLKELYKSKIEKKPIFDANYGVTGAMFQNTLFNFSGGPNASVPGVTNSTYYRVADTTEVGQNLYSGKRIYDTREGTSENAPGILRALLETKIYKLGKDYTYYNIAKGEPNTIIKYSTNPDGPYPGVTKGSVSSQNKNFSINVQNRVTDTSNNGKNFYDPNSTENEIGQYQTYKSAVINGEGKFVDNRLLLLHDSKIKNLTIEPGIWNISSDRDQILNFPKLPEGLFPGAGKESQNPINISHRVTDTTKNGENTYNPLETSTLSQTGFFASYLENNAYKYRDIDNNRLTLLYKSKISNQLPSATPELNTFNIIAGRDTELIKISSLSSKSGKPGTSSTQRTTNTTYANQLFQLGKIVSSANYSTFNQALISSQKLFGEGNTQVTDFRATIKTTEEVYNPSKPGQKLASSNYVEFNRPKTYGAGDPGKKGLDRSDPYGEGVKQLNGNLSPQTIDKVNFSPLYAKDVVNKTEADSDMIPFYITALDNEGRNNVFLHFRAFIESFGDSYNADWQSHKFMGRGESFYTYNGGNREISLTFKVHVQSKPELKVVYSKLNYLSSLMYPDYGLDTYTGGYMKGNLIKLTVGDYLTEVPGILKTLTYNIPNESPWDIGRDEKGDKTGLALPHLIEVSSFSFTPIHSFLPRKVDNNYVFNPTNKNMKSPFISMGKSDSGYTINTSLSTDANSLSVSPLDPINSSPLTNMVNNSQPIPPSKPNYIYVPGSGMDPGSVDPSTDYNFKAGK